MKITQFVHADESGRIVTLRPEEEATFTSIHCGSAGAVPVLEVKEGDTRTLYPLARIASVTGTETNDGPSKGGVMVTL